MPARSKKLLIAVVAVVGLLLVAVLAVLFTEFDSPKLGRLALDQIGDSVGLELEAEGFRLHLLRGLELQGVKASGLLGDDAMHASMERLVLKHRPKDLLSGTLTVTEVVLDQPRIELTSAGDAGAAVDTSNAVGSEVEASMTDEGGESSGTSLDLAISQIRLNDGTLIQRVTTDGVAETTEVRGLNVELHDLRFSSDAAANRAVGQGEIHIDEILLGPSAAVKAAESGDSDELTVIRDLEIDLTELGFAPGDPASLVGAKMLGELKIAEAISGVDKATGIGGQLELAEGQFKVQELNLTAPQGPLHGNVEADLAVEPMTYAMRLQGDALSTETILGLGTGNKLGTSTFVFTASGTGSDMDQLVGSGKLTFNGGELPDHPILVQVEQLLGNAALVGAGFDAFPVEFDIAAQRVNLAECELRVGPISLTLGGWVDFAGPLEMKLSVLTPREGLAIKEIPIEVLDALAEADGRINLPMLINGTADLAKVVLNKDFLKKAGQGYVRKTAERELTKALTGLFSKKKKKEGDQ